MPDDYDEGSQVRTTFEGGETDFGRIEFYEYSRSSYALARLISTVEAFRRTGHVPDRIMGSANIEVYTHLPELGSWTYLTELGKYAKEKIKLSVSFDSLFAWTSGKALDDLDLYNSNSDAIFEQNEDVDLSLADAFVESTAKRRRRRVKAVAANGQPQRLTKAALAQAKEKNDEIKVDRIAQETDIAVARQTKLILANSPLDSLEEGKARVAQVEKLASRKDVDLFDEEARLLGALSDFSEIAPTSTAAAASIASRMLYAANDLEPRLTRRSMGDRIGFAEVGADYEEAEKLATKARPLLKDVVLPLRKSPEELTLALDDDKTILRIDKVRGRMISDSVLSDQTFEIDVFVIEYNRVTHSGRCHLAQFGTSVPFSLRRELINRLNNQAIDSLKDDHRTFIARAYMNDDGAVRSLLVENIV